MEIHLNRHHQWVSIPQIEWEGLKFRCITNEDDYSHLRGFGPNFVVVVVTGTKEQKLDRKKTKTIDVGWVIQNLADLGKALER